MDHVTKSRPTPRPTTLLELVTFIDAHTAHPDATVALVRRLIDEGRVRLIGNFRDRTLT